MMILQACVDDSGSRTTLPERMYLLGGLLTDVDRWEMLAGAWAVELDKPPHLDYFKLSEALSMTGEFEKAKGWNEDLRDERVLALARIIRAHVEMGVVIFLSHTSYNNLVVPFTDFRPLKDPYFLLFHHMTHLISRQADKFPDMKKLQYVFDKNGAIGETAISYWDHITVEASSRSGGKIHGSTPIPQDDKEFLPLQAADLHAGVSRHDLEQNWSDLIRDCAHEFNGMPKRSVAAEYDNDLLLRFAAGLLVRRLGG